MGKDSRKTTEDSEDIENRESKLDKEKEIYRTQIGAEKERLKIIEKD